MGAAVDLHPAKVARVAAALRAHAGGRPVSFKKRAVAHQVPKRGDRTRARRLPRHVPRVRGGHGAWRRPDVPHYYDEATFWRIFDRPHYMAVKARTDPDNLLRDLYSKTCRAPRGLDDAPVALDRTNATHAAH